MTTTVKISRLGSHREIMKSTERKAGRVSACWAGLRHVVKRPLPTGTYRLSVTPLAPEQVKRRKSVFYAVLRDRGIVYLSALPISNHGSPLVPIPAKVGWPVTSIHADTWREIAKLPVPGRKAQAYGLSLVKEAAR